MTDADRAEWIEERAAIIQEGEGVDRYRAYHLAVLCWDRTYGDGRQRGLFDS